jgi:hypothetical protein
MIKIIGKNLSIKETPISYELSVKPTTTKKNLGAVFIVYE